MTEISWARWGALLLVASLTLGDLARAQTSNGDDPAVVMTREGAVRGVVADGVRSFKGIPYALPPTGERRFALPEPAQPWSGVRDATGYGSACPQLERYGIPESSRDENCLFVNVTAPYRPGDTAATPRPVLVWIHGGAFVGGSSGLYPLEALARQGDLVVVSLNYRLGVLGFTAHPAFAAEYNGGYGLMDQRAALAWVKRNIAAFGGDPGKVTVAGESAGAGSVCMHLLAPEQTTGLFERAIVVSAGCASWLPSVAEGEKIGLDIARKVGCSDPATALACLRSKPVGDLLEAGAAIAGSNILTFTPLIGAKTVPLPGAEAFPAGRFVQVPVMNGGTRDEQRLYVGYAALDGDVVTAETYPDAIRKVYGDKATAVLEKYPPTYASSPPATLGSVWSDFRRDVGINNCAYLEAAKLMGAFVPVHEFVFADSDAPPVTPADPGFEMGAVHSSELPYLFPHFDNTMRRAGPELAPASAELAKVMIGYWASFARTGTPVAPGGPAWPVFRADDQVMNLEPGKLGLFNAAVAHNCAFWKGLYPTDLTR
ncbi:carboxylesterase/lipase family protein [Ancylobacter sp. IITR112]|uniref:carboxylesterase/lipase family protein n=1 Tax=Ancylobacter sp. IITR112 TaxID=3138073 RepID=UPI00352B96F2